MKTKIQNIILGILVLAAPSLGGCRNEHFASKFSEANFKKVARGDSLSKVEQLLGRPLTCVVRENQGFEGKVLGGKQILIVEFQALSQWENDPQVYVDLHYSQKKHNFRPFRQYRVILQNGRVFETISSEVD